jgi:hypothetical protein
MAEISTARKLPVEFVVAYFNPLKHDTHSQFLSNTLLILLRDKTTRNPKCKGKLIDPCTSLDGPTRFRLPDFEKIGT